MRSCIGSHTARSKRVTLYELIRQIQKLFAYVYWRIRTLLLYWRWHLLFSLAFPNEFSGRNPIKVGEKVRQALYLRPRIVPKFHPSLSLPDETPLGIPSFIELQGQFSCRAMSHGRVRCAQASSLATAVRSKLVWRISMWPTDADHYRPTPRSPTVHALEPSPMAG